MAATQIEQEPVEHAPVEQGPTTALSPGRSSRFPAKSPDVESRLLVRRGRIRSLRRLLVLTDAATTLGIVALAVAVGSGVTTAMALAVLLAVTAHVCAADSPRAGVAVRSVLRSALVVGGGACVAAAVLGSRPVGREILLGVVGTSAALAAVRVLPRVPRLASWCGLGQRRRLIVGDPAALEATAARRAPAVEAGEVILVVTRAETPRTSTPPTDQGGSDATGDDQRQGRDERSGPTGVVERVVRHRLGLRGGAGHRRPRGQLGAGAAARAVLAAGGHRDRHGDQHEPGRHRTTSRRRRPAGRTAG